MLFECVLTIFKINSLLNTVEQCHCLIKESDAFPCHHDFRGIECNALINWQMKCIDGRLFGRNV